MNSFRSSLRRSDRHDNHWRVITELGIEQNATKGSYIFLSLYW